MRRAAVVLLLAAPGCITIGSPKEPFAMPSASAAQRVMQTRRFDTPDEAKALRASAALLMDLGFTVDCAEDRIGVLVASKDRTAVEVGQVVAAVIIAAFTGADVPYDHHQKLRASVVTHPAGEHSIAVRATFQRIVWDTHGVITRREQLNEPEYYREFFDKLSKALFLEAQQP
jgi:hypothetical protein